MLSVEGINVNWYSCILLVTLIFLSSFILQYCNGGDLADYLRGRGWYANNSYGIIIFVSASENPFKAP